MNFQLKTLKMDKVKILIVDDHQLILNGITEMLKTVQSVRIISTAMDRLEAVEQAVKLDPDVIFMDISMPKLNGIPATKAILEKLPGLKIVLLTQHDEHEYVVQALKAGASGYMLKNSRRESFEVAINTVLEGRKYFSQEIAEMMMNQVAVEDQENEQDEVHLTKREIEIIQKIADDMSNKQIADDLNISLRTVETHRRNLMQKLKVNTVVALLKYAAKRNLISFE